jgi:hypothetical protein
MIKPREEMAWLAGDLAERAGDSVEVLAADHVMGARSARRSTPRPPQPRLDRSLAVERASRLYQTSSTRIRLPVMRLDKV